MFFNPALFHAAGNEPLEGRAAHRQSAAGLLGLRPRDGERRPAQDEPEALSGAARSSGDHAITASDADNAIAACAEGYSFPTNLDRDPPKGGLAPKTQQDLMRQALKENWPPDVFSQEAEAQSERKLT